MLKPQPLANSLAVTSALLYLILFLLKIFSPPFFKLILNSQFYGADIASQIPRFGIANFLGLLIAVSVVSWILGYLVAVIYNHFAQKS